MGKRIIRRKSMDSMDSTDSTEEEKPIRRMMMDRIVWVAEGQRLKRKVAERLPVSVEQVSSKSDC